MTASDILAAQWVQSALMVFEYHKLLAEKAVVQLADDRLQVALHPETNSVAAIMKHVAGNLRSRWTDFLTSDGEKPWRDRDSEFVADFASRAELLAFWNAGWEAVLGTLRQLQPDDLNRTVTIRGEPHSVSLALERSLAHAAYHVGQIVLVSRILAGDNWQTLTIPRGESRNHTPWLWQNKPES